MNKSYRSVWNESLGAWVAGSELSRACGKRAGVSRTIRTAVFAAASIVAAHAGAQVASGAGATALGQGSIASGANSLAVAAGSDAKAAGDRSVAVGYKAQADGPDSVAVGYSTKVIGAASRNTTTVGSGNTLTNSSQSLTIGSQNTTTNSSVVGIIGGDNSATASFGSSMFGVGNKMSNAAASSIIGIQNTVTMTAPFNKNDPSTWSKANVIGLNNSVTNSTQNSVMGENNNLVGAKKNFIAGFDNKLGANLEGNQLLGSGATVADGVKDSVGAGTGVTVGASSSVAIGDKASVTARDSVAIGAGSVANGSTLGSTAYIPPGATSVAGTRPVGEVSVGAAGKERRITNVAAGSQDTDGVNVSQLKALQGTIQQVSNVANNAGDKWAIGSPTTYVPPSSKGKDSTAVGSGSSVNADNSVAVGTGAKVTTNNSVALGNGSVADKPAVPTGSTVINGTTYQFAGGNPVGVVSVGAPGQERQITNVAAGQLNANSTDAVNGSQLYQTNQAINSLTNQVVNGGGIKYFHANSTEADSQAKGTNSVAIGPKAVANGENGVASGMNSAANGANSVAMGPNASANTKGSVALGDGAVADRVGMGGGKEAFSGKSVASTQGAISVGSVGGERQITNVAGGTKATDAVNVRQLQSVKDGAVNYDTRPDGTVNYNSVTMGNPNGDGAGNGKPGGASEVAIHNVAAGVAGTDVVNVNQLNGARAAANAYTDARVNALSAEVQDVARNAYGGTAAAMAVQAPATFVPGKTVMRLGYGNYKGESAVGISFRRTAENNGWSVTGGLAASRGGVAATVGGEWVFN
ncbi:ESPR-type extended signal peptide-containing protein [Variovorax sp. J22R133]|uniref:ESPR-type extended signal peptide-containing protein n=1 Tax=Variovorax brevis TaxID=3053503 RepID=UPI002578E564|nr:ESPR-type extended signal peptide-containing protein [Variovorax sp. J22R133]MDM0111522.1 ESPR-type extended signal peptide-containing protein [Variovorax sp. J22R133]